MRGGQLRVLVHDMDKPDAAPVYVFLKANATTLNDLRDAVEEKFNVPAHKVNLKKNPEGNDLEGTLANHNITSGNSIYFYRTQTPVRLGDKT
jgi:nucleoside-diphosphate-sugar epimerase